MENGRVRIVREGTIGKFVEQVEQVSFSGEIARAAAQEVRYVTERAVFRLTPEGIELIEIAPGIDLQKQVLDLMAFPPRMRQIGLMPAYLFHPPKGI